MSTLSPQLVAGFAVTIVGQIAALSLIPATRGFTAVLPTVACSALFIFSLAVSARLVHSGVELSLLTPIATVLIQISVVIIGITVFGESASPARIGLLLCAALMIGSAMYL